MKLPNESNRRTVLKTIGAGVVGGTVLTGSAAGHGDDPPRFPAWFESEIWEMAGRPGGISDDESHAPIWHIAPAADGKSCAQVPGVIDFSDMEDGKTFAEGEWGSPSFDETLSAFPFSSIWHIHWVFDETASKPYTPDDMVNVDHNGDPLINGTRIRNATNVDIVSIPFAFNCPIRPADEEHSNYCR